MADEAPILAEEQTTWRAGDLTVVYAYCDTVEALREGFTSNRLAPGCHLDRATARGPRGHFPIACELKRYAGEIAPDIGAWWARLDGGREGYVALAHGTGRHLAVARLVM